MSPEQKIAECHNVMDAAGVYEPGDTHPQLINRIRLLIRQRDEAREVNKALPDWQNRCRALEEILKLVDEWVGTGAYGKYLPLGIYSKMKEVLSGDHAPAPTEPPVPGTKEYWYEKAQKRANEILGLRTEVTEQKKRGDRAYELLVEQHNIKAENSRLEDRLGTLELILKMIERYKADPASVATWVPEMKVPWLDDLIRERNHYRAEAYRLANNESEAVRELERLKSGALTPDELNALCHNLHECGTSLTRAEFAQACKKFQDKVFGDELGRCNVPTVSVQVDRPRWAEEWKRLDGEFTAEMRERLKIPVEYLNSAGDKVRSEIPLEPPHYVPPPPYISPREPTVNPIPNLSSRSFTHKGLSVVESVLADGTKMSLVWARPGANVMFSYRFDPHKEGDRNHAVDQCRLQFEVYYQEEVARHDDLQEAARRGASELHPK